MPNPSLTQRAQRALDAADRELGSSRRNNPKLACPECQHEISVVKPDKGIRLRDHDDGLVYRRLRECQACGTLFASVERVERVVRKGSTAA